LRGARNERRGNLVGVNVLHNKEIATPRSSGARDDG
jgi:hypothetical protein